VRGEITFSAFVREASEDFARMARIAARRRRPPSWMGLDDITSMMITFAHHYGFERVSKDGHVGFDPARYTSAGAYIRWKIRARVGKELSRARGENQHDRKGPPAPEFLSWTGELGGPGGLPERSEPATAEAVVDRSLRFDRLKRLCETVKEFAIVSALARGLGDDRHVIGFLMEHPEAKALGFDTPETAAAAVDGFVTNWTKQLGPLKKRAVIKEMVAA
jgi:hypothetical protein